MIPSNSSWDSGDLPFGEREHIDRICLAFEDECRRGEKPQIEAYLSNVSHESTAPLLRELLALEYYYLAAEGGQPSLEEYKSRFSSHAAIVEQVFQSTVVRGRATADSADPSATAVGLRCPQCRALQQSAPEQGVGESLCTACGFAFTVLADECSDESAAGRHIGRFELLRAIGSGQFGIVWLARDESLDRVVAIKLPRKGQLSSDETEQFLREARAAAQLKHPHIVPVHEVGRDADVVYIVSEYIDGPTLADWLADARPDVRAAVELCRTLANALHHAHEAGVVHRDLKPSNILLARAKQQLTDGPFPFVPYIADFGLAKRDAGEITITLAGRLIGTPAYMSPEQARGEAHAADRRSDVYSLGVILFQLLTGELPFRGNVRMLLWQILKEEPPSPRKLNGVVPRDLETITLKCLEKNPEKRYQTAAELADDLGRFLRAEPIVARPVSRIERTWRWVQRNRRVAALAAMLGAALLAGFVGVTWQWRRAAAEAGMVKLKTVEANRNFEDANQAVDEFLTTVSESQLLNVPSLQPLRRELLEKALGYYTKFAGQSHADFEARARAVAACHAIARIRNHLGSAREAEQAFELAVSQAQSLLAERPGSTSAKFQLASAMQDAAISQIDKGDFHRAHELLIRSRSLLEELRTIPDDESDEKSRQLQDSFLAMNYRQLAKVQFITGQFNDARQTADRGLALVDTLLEKAPSDVAFLRAAAALRGISANLYQKAGDVEKCLGETANAVEITERCLQYGPKSIEMRAMLAAHTGDKGVALICAGKSEEGTICLRNAVQITDALAQDNPQVPMFRAIQAGTRDQLAMQLVRSSKVEESVEVAKRAVYIAKSLCDDYPDNAGFRQILAHSQALLAISQTRLGQPGTPDN